MRILLQNILKKMCIRMKVNMKLHYYCKRWVAVGSVWNELRFKVVPKVMLRNIRIARFTRAASTCMACEATHRLGCDKELPTHTRAA